MRSPKPNLLLEVVFLLETVADSRWHVDQFLAPTPVRVVVDLRGNDLTATRPAAALAEDFVDATLQRFLERPGFNAALLKTMLASATEQAESLALALKSAAGERAAAALGAELQRLIDLQRLNDHVRPEEIAGSREQMVRTGAAIAEARLRLDSIRLVVEGPQTLG
jgi:ATP-dependent helicase HepA